tara:strand:+ start:477 stop:1388 length:912 start_codon:yes stop_codon:yes gene_type:complete
MHKKNFYICSFYKFTNLNNLDELKKDMVVFFKKNNVRGTILIGNEGINGSISLKKEMFNNFKTFLETLLSTKLFLKIQLHNFHAFLRLKVKIKKEIIKLGEMNVDPKILTGNSISPTLWDKIIHDENFVIIDTRNDYESEIGSFKNSIKANTKNFTEFPKWFKRNKKVFYNKKVAMFCTGGIRCEKASNFLLNKGIKDVHQLEGGIINYLSTTKNNSRNWYGECFVFDERVSINDKLQKGIYSQCFACRSPITESEINSTFYKKGVSCPHCYKKTSKKKKEGFEERERQIKIAKKKGIKHLGS